MTDWTRKLVRDKHGRPFYVGVRDGMMVDWRVRNLGALCRPLPEQEFVQTYLQGEPA